MNMRGLCKFVQNCQILVIRALIKGTYPTILILEDDRDTLEEVNETLTDDGFLNLCAINIQAFENLPTSHVIDLFLIDLNLPDGNDFTLVRETRRESEVGIIIVSGKTSETDRVVG
jgi:two-component system OmpR family response regulator